MAYPSLVQQFYTNLECHGDSYTTFVKGKSLYFSVMDFGSILNVFSSGVCPFTKKGALHFPFTPLEQLQIVMNNNQLTDVFTPKTVDVSPISCVLHHIVRYNLLPRLGGGADFTYQDLIIVSLILRGVSFNLSQLMLHHMTGCLRKSKTCLPYSATLTTLFTHFQISFDNEHSVSVTDSLSVSSLKMSRINLIDGLFVRIPSEIPAPPVSIPSSPLQIPTQSSTEIVDLLKVILNNQEKMQVEMSALHNRMFVLEKGKLPLGAPEINKLYHNFEDEFIDLQAGFEVQTTALAEMMQRRLNRNSCQLSQEIKFVSNQLGELADFVSTRFNDVGANLHMPRKHSTVPEWVHCNWLAEYRGEFLDVPLPPATVIPRPPQFATDLSIAEKVHRANHRPYFTERAARRAAVVELDE